MTGGAPRTGLRGLASESLVYGLGQAGGRAVQLLLVPILTRVLDPGAYGVAELVIAYAQTAVLVLVLGLDGALARFFYQEPDREARIRMVSSSFALRLAVSTLAAAALAAAAGPLATALVGGEVYRKYVAIGAATLPLTLLVLFGTDVLRVTFQPWKFLVLTLAQTVSVAGLSIALVVGAGLGVAGVLYARLIGDGLAALLAMVLVRHVLRPRFSREALRRLLAYGLPSVPALAAFGVLASIDRYVLQSTRSLAELAVYAVAMKFFTVVTFAASAFQLAYGPFAFARAGDPGAPRLYARALSWYVAIGSLGALLVALFAPEALAVLVPEAYAGAALPAAALAFAAVAFGAYTVSSVGIGLALRTPLLSLCAAGAAAVMAAGQFALAPRWGPPGAAAATWLGFVAAAVLTYVAAQRVHPLPYRGARLLALFAIATALGVAGQRLAPAGAAGVAARLAIAAGFGLLLRVAGIWAIAPRPAAGGRDT